MSAPPAETASTTSNLRYDWERFLLPRGSAPDLSDGGFLRAPGDWFAASGSVAPIALRTVGDRTCLAILGEHGIGKSAVMESLAGDLRHRQAGDTLWVDLSLVGSESRFDAKVAHNAKIAAWRSGSHRLSLFLDGLDEGLMRVDYLVGLLREWLSDLGEHRQRLSLRISCRTGDWPGKDFEDYLCALWPTENCSVYEVAPLQRADVIAAAEIEGIDPYAFIREVLRVEAASLAIRPLTLVLLLNTFGHGNARLPAMRRDIYQDGIVELCTERGRGRRESRQTGDFTQQQRMAVAARIAYLTTFAGLNTIRTVPPRGDLQDGEIALEELIGGTVGDGGGLGEFAVTRGAVMETLGSGLFTARAADCLGWAHRDYRDFLAARFVAHSAIGAGQCMALLQDPDDPDGAIAPPLRSVAAWIAESDAEVFGRILSCDYGVLLDADAVPLAERSRALLAARLLSLPDKAALLRRAYVAGSLPNFSQPGLAAQLTDALASGDSDTALLAIAIARDSGERGILGGRVADIALDGWRPLVLRAAAAYAIANIDDIDVHDRLRPLALAPDPQDVRDELKGNALRACWPAHLTAAELFAALTRPRVGNFVGAYKGFLCTDILRHVRDDDLGAALAWVAREPGDYFLERIADGIFWRALPLLDRPDIAHAFAPAFLARHRRQQQLMRKHGEGMRFVAALCDSVLRRRRLVEALLPILGEWNESSILLIYGDGALVGADDLHWVIERASRSDGEAQGRWLDLLLELSGRLDAEGWGAIHEACEAVPAIHSIFAEAFAPVNLGSQKAEEMRAQHARHEAALQAFAETQEPPPALPALPARLAPLLDRSKGGEVAAWIALCREIARHPDGRLSHDYAFTIGLLSHPEWEGLSGDARDRIAAAAERYLGAWTPTPERWLARDSLFEGEIVRDWAGMQALVLLQVTRPAALVDIPSDAWGRWAPVVAGFPYLTDKYPLGAIHALVAEAYRRDPMAVTETIAVRIRHEAERHGYITALSLLAGCWDDALAAALLDIAARRELPPGATGQLLDALLDRGAAVALPFLESLVGTPPTDERDRQYAVVAAHLIARRAPDLWPKVWEAVTADPAFGCELVDEMVRTDHWSATSARDLGADALADLYVWLVARYPPRADPSDNDDDDIFHEITVREDIGSWRDSIPALLRERATPDAVAALERLGAAFPGFSWLRIVAAEAADTLREATWRPQYTPAQLLRLARDRRSRLVQTGDQLLVAIEESIGEMARNLLHGVTPQVPLLWNDLGNGQWRPKAEEALSDYVKSYLERELPDVVVNREVEIHLGHDRLDIVVDTLTSLPGGDRISVIVEIKGGWNGTLYTSMQTQLADRYLANGPYLHGLYLVGWYMCDQWDRNDNPHFGTHPKLGGIAALESRLDTQAANLSTDGRRIHTMVLNVAFGTYSTPRRGRRRTPHAATQGLRCARHDVGA